MGQLEGKVAVVTGGGSGIGRGTCRRMAAEGAQVAVLDLDGDSAAGVAGEVGGVSFAVDVRDPDAVRAAVPHLLAGGGGSIVNTASISGIRPSPGEGPYSAAKAAIVALTQSAALEYGPRGIRVNAVAPGAIRSAMTTPLLGLGEWEQIWTDRTPLGRVGDPEDIADVVVFLCSDLARYITGQVLVVDGGMILHGAGIDGVLDYVMQMLGRD